MKNNLEQIVRGCFCRMLCYPGLKQFPLKAPWHVYARCKENMTDSRDYGKGESAQLAPFF